MKKYLILSLILAVSSSATSAAPKEAFTCEKIKDRPTRTLCISERNSRIAGDNASTKASEDNVAMENAEKERIAAEKEILNQTHIAIMEYVNQAKKLLSQNLKDPDSAKFSNVVLVQNQGRRLVCGSINAKNSYGGYVGAKKFYVLWNDAMQTPSEVYTDGDEVARASARIKELSHASRNEGLGGQISAAQEGDRVMANVRLEVARNAKVISEQCTASAENKVTSIPD